MSEITDTIPDDQKGRADGLYERIFSRQPQEVTKKLKTACVGIAGLGGLGSVVAENLVRSGLGSLILVDDDLIEASNLNRQRYRLDQIGLSKTDALIDNLESFHPFTKLTGHQIRVDADNCADLFMNCDAVAECFDNPESKAALITGLRRQKPEMPIVAASGLSGLGPVEALKVDKRMENVYIVGDQLSDARDGTGLFAARVGIVASMQAHIIVRLLTNQQ